MIFLSRWISLTRYVRRSKFVLFSAAASESRKETLFTMAQSAAVNHVKYIHICDHVPQTRMRRCTRESFPVFAHRKNGEFFVRWPGMLRLYPTIHLFILFRQLRSAVRSLKGFIIQHLLFNAKRIDKLSAMHRERENYQSQLIGTVSQARSTGTITFVLMNEFKMWMPFEILLRASFVFQIFVLFIGFTINFAV